MFYVCNVDVPSRIHPCYMELNIIVMKFKCDNVLLVTVQFASSKAILYMSISFSYIIRHTVVCNKDKSCPLASKVKCHAIICHHITLHLQRVQFISYLTGVDHELSLLSCLTHVCN